MLRKGADRERVLEVLHDTSRAELERVSRETGVPAADVYGVGSFYSLVSGAKVTRVCQGLSCWMAGSDGVLADLRARGEPHEAVSCIGQCDRAPAWLDPELSAGSAAPRGALTPDDSGLPMNLGGADTTDYAGLARALELGPDGVLAALEASGLQGRGGAAFPAGRKWRSVRAQAERERYVVCNADESEPATFKDRDVMARRPHLLLEGLAIGAP